jgi:hypothetical protein
MSFRLNSFPPHSFPPHSFLLAGEHKNLAAANPDIVATLWAALNQTILTTRDCVGWSYKGRPHGGIPGAFTVMEHACLAQISKCNN